MGYSYCQGQLCCDHCDNYGPEHKVRRRKCPANWCQPPALCAACYRTMRLDGTWDRGHATCPASAAEYRERNAREQALLDAGHAVCKAALGFHDGTGRVKVWFRYRDGREELWVMDTKTYNNDKRPMLEPWTVADYQAIGPCERMEAE